jgi:undecaprenyl diphosphate synthase
MFERYRTRQSLENSKMRLNLLYNYLPENREKSATIPDLDLVIRTGGCCRLSGFLPEQSRYAELYFLDKLWPDSTADDFEEAVLWYKKQEETVFG